MKKKLDDEVEDIIPIEERKENICSSEKKEEDIVEVIEPETIQQYDSNSGFTQFSMFSGTGGMFNVFTSGSPDIKISINGKEINLRDEEEKKNILENNIRGLGKEE